MKPIFISSIMLAALLIPFFATLMFRYWGWLGMTLYLLYAGLCLYPSVVKYRRIRNRDRDPQSVKVVADDIQNLDIPLAYISEAENRLNKYKRWFTIRSVVHCWFLALFGFMAGLLVMPIYYTNGIISGVCYMVFITFILGVGAYILNKKLRDMTL